MRGDSKGESNGEDRVSLGVRPLLSRVQNGNISPLTVRYTLAWRARALWHSSRSKVELLLMNTNAASMLSVSIFCMSASAIKSNRGCGGVAGIGREAHFKFHNGGGGTVGLGRWEGFPRHPSFHPVSVGIHGPLISLASPLGLGPCCALCIVARGVIRKWRTGQARQRII